MYQGLDHFGKCFQYQYKGKSKEAIFIFHGFPSQKNRNKDIAFALSQSTPHTVIVHHYEGLGESLGEFTFLKSLQSAEKFIAHHLQVGGYKKIHFIGHSWGGFVSLNMLRQYLRITDKVFLLSPFNQIPENKNLNMLVESLFAEYPHCFFHTTKTKVKKDFLKVEKNYDLISFLKTQQINLEIRILQAKKDQAVPEVTTKILHQYLGQKAQYKEIEVDHSFAENRKAKIRAIQGFFRK